MFTHLLIWRVPILFGAGALAGWLGARYELKGARAEDDTRGSALLLRGRTLQYAVSFYLILATIAFCSGGLYSSQFWRTPAPSQQVSTGLLSSGLQALVTGALSCCLFALHFINQFSHKYGLDLW